MRIDLESLGTFNQLVKEGAESAADAITQLTGLDTAVDVTKINFVPLSDLKKELDEDLGHYSGIHLGFHGTPTGHAIIALRDESADELARALLGGTEEPGMERAALKELGNITVSGFIDGWANYLETTIDITPPSFVDHDGFQRLWKEFETEAEEYAIAFNSTITAGEGTASFRIYILPTDDTMDRALDSVEHGEGAVDTRELGVFSSMTREGARQIAQNVSLMTGIDTDARITNLHFMSLEDLSSEVGETEVVGALLRFQGIPSGYVMIFFDHDSAREIVGAMLDGEADIDDELGRSALEELGNIMTSSLVDGWANALGTEIDMSVPHFVNDIGQAIIDPILINLAQHQRFAFSFDTLIKSDQAKLTCKVYALPDAEGLKNALRTLEERGVATSTDAYEA